jgi:hypothetical protein
LGVGLAMAFVPEIFYDSLVYHLGVPRWWLLEGGVRYYPSTTAQLPFARQMLNLFGLALGGEPLAKLIHWSSAPLMVLTFAAMARRHSTPTAAWVASLGFFSMPMVNANLWTAGVDVGMSAFALLAALCFLNALTDPGYETGWSVLAGVFSGLVFASKYTGFLWVVCLGIVLTGWFWVVKRELWRGLRLGLLFGGAAFLLILPWLVKSWILTGNPFYPYFAGVFSSRDFDPVKFHQFAADTRGDLSRSLTAFVARPWTATFNSISSFTAPGVIPLGFLGFFGAGLVGEWRHGKWFTALGTAVTVYLAAMTTQTFILRMAMPGLAALCFLLGHGVARFEAGGKKVYRFGVGVLILASALAGYEGCWASLKNTRPKEVLTGRESRREYQSYTHPGWDPYPATALFEFAKDNLPSGSRLLILGDEKTASCRMPFLASGIFNPGLMVRWAREARAPEDILASCRKAGVTHLAVNPAEARRLEGYGILDWDETSFRRFCDFWDRHVRLVHEEIVTEKAYNGSYWLGLYVLEDRPADLRPPPNPFKILFPHETRVDNPAPAH